MSDKPSIATIVPSAAQLEQLDYAIPAQMSLQVGDVVHIPFRSKEILGVVWELKNHSQFSKLKEVIALEDGVRLNADFRKFLIKLAEYYLSPLGSVMKMVLNFDKIEELPSLEQVPLSMPELSSDQQAALSYITNATMPTLLKGVTGSGKTEVYFHLIEQCLKLGQQVLVMIPEIGLSSQMISRFTERFGFPPLIWNSGVTKAKKRKIYSHIIKKQPLVVFGTRSSLLLPYNNLGLIVVDEEHDASYKQEESVRYNARDMAVLRSSICGCRVLLLSATPSVETIQNVATGKYGMVELTSRFGNAVMPEVELIDMRNEQNTASEWISPSLHTALQETLHSRSQALLFLNRKGYSPLILCRSCGHRVSCPNCSSYLVLHKGKKRLECHLCAYLKAIPSSCPECKTQDELVSIGPGIERIAEEVSLKFPQARILTISRDDMSTQKKIDYVLKRIEFNEVDIIIGTQIITKGYHFPNLALVGILDADSGLVGGDLRASERTYQLLHQVGGRAGRVEAVKGRLLVQTYQPESKLIQALHAFDDEAFVDYELSSRQAATMPPFSRMASVMIQGKNEQQITQLSNELVAQAQTHPKLRILGPAPSMIARLNRMYRMRIILIAPKNFNIQKYIKNWLSNAQQNKQIPSHIKILIDIDPYNLL